MATVLLARPVHPGNQSPCVPGSRRGGYGQRLGGESGVDAADDIRRHVRGLVDSAQQPSDLLQGGVDVRTQFTRFQVPA
ncbi:hypothetical protein [Streptomyces sp. NPDC052292]|uniref:hypothetical protein n=1 Tax=Streptomyces sp. NPDC052292 TaxID=3155053 RepID=UPI003436EDF9